DGSERGGCGGHVGAPLSRGARRIIEGRPGFPGTAPSVGGVGPCRAPTQSWSATHYRGPSRVSRDGSERGGVWGRVGPPLSRGARRIIEGRPGFPGTAPSVGGVGAM